MSRPLVVMKFGGTSVADPEKIARAAERAVQARRKGARVVVVVSAPGDMTDELLSLARQVNPNPDQRELDVLVSTGEMVSISLFSMACLGSGAPAISLSGPQAGIFGDEHHTRSAITAIRPQKILKELAQGKIVAVAGFQALNPNLDVTTLGRGGSDLSAVALAARLKADRCEIYTDVKGVYTADPRLVSQARKINSLSYEEMLELSAAGAKVMLARSIEIAKRYRIKIHVRSAFHPVPGTWIVSRSEARMEKAHISSLAVDKGVVRLTIVDVPDKPGIAARVLSKLAGASIPVDMVVQSAAAHASVNDISFITPRVHSKAAQKALKDLTRALGAKKVDVQDHVVKLTAVGTGFRRNPAFTARVFESLAKNKINIQMISTSDLRVSCIIDRRHADLALNKLHAAFKLGRKR